MFYTHKEKTLKRHGLNFIITQARAVLDAKNISTPVNTSVLDGKGKDELFTTEEANKLINKIVDTGFYQRPYRNIPMRRMGTNVMDR